MPKIIIRADRLLRPEVKLATEDQHVLIEDGNVSALLPRTQIPGDAQLIDLPGCTLLPGLIDCHTHLTLPPEVSEILDELRRSPATCALESIPNVRDKLLSGFTTVREAGSYWALVDVAVRDAVNAGLIPGPRMFVPGAMVSMTGGAGAMTGLASEIELPPALRFGSANGPYQVRERIRDLVSRGADHIKVFASGAVMQHGCGCPTTGEFTLEELSAAVDEAKAFERKVMAHAHSPLGIKNAVAAGVASIEHGTMLDNACAEFMAANGTFLVPTLSVWDPAKRSVSRPADFTAKAQIVREHHDKAIEFALKSGVKIALGSDSCVRAHDRGARELHHMVRLGMTEMDAIRSATVLAAELLGISDIGAVQPGYRADVIAVRGNPLRQIDAFDDVVFVMKDGVVYKNATTAVR